MPKNRFYLAFALAGSLCLASMPGFAAPAPAPAISAPTTVAPVTIENRIAAQIQHEIAVVQPLLDRYGYGAVAVAVGVEGAGIPAPGETLLVAAALDAASHPKLHIGWLVLAAFAAASVGNSLGYLIGRLGGRPLLRRLRVNERYLARIEAIFERWGGWLIVGARFFDGPRQLNGIAAGILKMPWWHFTRFNLLGAALWVGTWGLGPYFLDEHLQGILTLVRRWNPWVAGATVLGLIVLAVYLWIRFKRAALPDVPSQI